MAFLKELIGRKEYRLLTIDGNVLLKKNHDENTVVGEGMQSANK